MDKEISKLTESILNELAIISQRYRDFKKVYDAAFKKGLPLWEKKAKARGYTPATVSDLLKGCKKDEPELYPYVYENLEYFFPQYISDIINAPVMYMMLFREAVVDYKNSLEEVIRRLYPLT